MISLLFFISYIGFVVTMSLLINNYYLIILWLVLGILFGLLIVILFVVLNFPIFKKQGYKSNYMFRVFRSITVFANRFIFRVKVKVDGIENIPKDGRLTIYANHKSYVDPFIMFQVFNRPITFTPKKGVYKIPILRKILEYLHAFPIDREDTRNTVRALVEAIKIVKDEMAMLIFPEGGIKDRDEEKMVEMRAGAYKLAMKAEANLLPISIYGATQIKKRAPFRSTKVDVKIHPLIYFDEVKDLTTHEVAGKMFEIINQEL